MAWTTVGVTLSLLVGLALARLLAGLVAVFRARRRATLDWIPIAWTFVLILALLETWTALGELSRLIERFSFGEYLALAGLLMVLFAAASLILPPGEIGTSESLRDHFRDEGRFALPLVSLYLAGGAVINVTLFAGSLLEPWFALDLPLILLPLVVFAGRSRRTREIATAAYLPLLAVDIYVSLTS